LKNNIKNLLISLEVCNESSIKSYYPRTRDKSNISILKCNKSGVIFLSQSEHIEKSYYEQKQDFAYWSVKDRKHAINVGFEDRLRRKELLNPIVKNRKWIDIGTGSGGILDELSHIASEVCAVEPQIGVRENLEELGYDVYQSIQSVDKSGFDVVTFFHVFEHLTNPIEDLVAINQKMANGGKIIIEVPHANDFLISFLDHEGFKKFTFWSEHLILHTRYSLSRFLEKAGFEDIIITSCQRYPLANHLHWLSKSKPGGHEKWSFLRTPELDSAYTNMLSQLDKTDTLIAVATKKVT
jgi:SAM-dependent methyltransferase